MYTPILDQQENHCTVKLACTTNCTLSIDLTSSCVFPGEDASNELSILSMTCVMGRSASNGPRSITVHDEVSVNRASANSSGVATFGPIDYWIEIASAWRAGCVFRSTIELVHGHSNVCRPFQTVHTAIEKVSTASSVMHAFRHRHRTTNSRFRSYRYSSRYITRRVVHLP